MVKSLVWGYVRIVTGTILGGTVGFYVAYLLEISFKGPKGTDNCADKRNSGPSSFESSEMAVCKTSILKSGAISEGYNFASTWEQNAPLTKQQQAAVVALSHAVGLEHTCGQDIGLSISRKHSTSEECGATETIMASRRDKNQFYKWFTDLEAATKSETEQKYQQYVIALTRRLQACDGILQQVDDTIELLLSITAAASSSSKEDQNLL
ncbi:hypothetical protein RJ640_008325 [Escallonia rubra]|uniref:Uncharacterized protein n=1 Tax=Escallonia rubra TaxID=112253 RepID=A0AA88R493_9ASTE|nr:hypothetical protein RJ640_008325 [Escallonia rubra]